MASSYALPPTTVDGFVRGNGYALHGHGHQRSRTGYLAPLSAVPSSPVDGATVKKNKSLGDLGVFGRRPPTPPDSATSPSGATAPFDTKTDGEYALGEEMKSGRLRGISDLGRPLSSAELAHMPSAWSR